MNEKEQLITLIKNNGRCKNKDTYIPCNQCVLTGTCISSMDMQKIKSNALKLFAERYNETDIVEALL